MDYWTECVEEVEEFLIDNPDPLIKTATTIKNGFVVCIPPIKTICGAELICSPKTKPSLMKILRGV